MNAQEKYPWLKHYPEGVDWHRKFTPRPVHEIFDEAAKEFSDHPYLNFFGRKFTYKEIAGYIERAARGLQDLGVNKGSKVGLYLVNCPQYVICYYAILKAGGTVVNFSPLYSKEELVRQIDDSETDFMITLDLRALYPNMQGVVRNTRLRKLVICEFAKALPPLKKFLFQIFGRKKRTSPIFSEHRISFTDLLANEGDPAAISIAPEEDIALLQYTGGTTGVPKGAMLTHANVYVQCKQLTSWDRVLQPGEEKVLAVLPFFHVFAMSVLLNAGTDTGCELILFPKFNVKEAVRAIKEHRITMMAVVPAMLTAINDYAALHRVDLSSLQAVSSGGAPLPLSVLEEFERISGALVLEGYGLSETSPVVTTNPRRGLRKPGSVGIPIAATVIAIVDRDDPNVDMPLGEAGEVLVSGPQVMKAYWNRPEASAAVMHGGRFRTGDVGYLDEDGFLFIIDRIKDMISVGGFKVYPRHVEDALQSHPAVAEVSVIGIPDHYLGEVPKAFVRLKPGVEKVNAEDLLAFVKPSLGKHELPHEIEFRDSLPKTMVGKLSKKDLAEENEKRN